MPAPTTPQPEETWIRKKDGARVKVAAVVAAKPTGQAVLYLLGDESVSESLSNFLRFHRPTTEADEPVVVPNCATCPFKALALAVRAEAVVKKARMKKKPHPGNVCGQCTYWSSRVMGAPSGWCKKRNLHRRRKEPFSDRGDDEPHGKRCADFLRVVGRTVT